MANIAELFSQKNVLDYVNNRQAPVLLGETLFPARKVQGLEFDVLKADLKSQQLQAFMHSIQKLRLLHVLIKDSSRASVHQT